jgi:hypothetical protein
MRYLYGALALCLAGIHSPAAENDKLSIRRLSHSQYNNTVRDLLGDETRPADRFPQEDYVNGFKNQSAAQDIPPLLAEAYDAAAAKLARTAFRTIDDAVPLLGCRPASPQDRQCVSTFIRSFGAKAFRRPLTEGETERYVSLVLRVSQRSGRFEAGAQLAAEAILQSPKFLFLIERGPQSPSKDYEIANRLSYFLWDTMPDAGLYRSAAAGELSTADGLNKSIRRMIADPRVHQSVDQFVEQWLRFDLVLNAVRDRATYPQFTPELALAMTEETRRLIQDIVENNRDFTGIFSAPYGFLNSELASLYDLPAPATEFARVEFPAGSDRAGILGQATFLALTSKPGETSPTIRGFFVREHFLCERVPDPPPGTNSTLPPLAQAKPQTNRERLQEHVINAACAGCHTLMDPVGFGLEKFDAIGKRREKQTITFLPDRHDRNGKPVVIELPLDTTGVVRGMPGSEFSNPKQLGSLLGASPKCQECIVKQLFRYAFGRRETSSDRPMIKEAFENFRASRFNFKELMMYLAVSLVRQEARSN